MTETMARQFSRSSLRFSSLLLPSNRLLSTAVPTITLARHPSLPHPPSAFRFNTIQCRVNRAGNSTYSTLNSEISNVIERPPADTAPLFAGCDYEHWLVIIDKPGGEGATKQQMIDCYVQTLAKVLGSEEEAKKKIYSISCNKYLGFGCEIDEETSNKLEGELFVNGEVVQRPPERQRRLDREPQKDKDRPRSNDRTRYVRRKEGTR